MLHPTLQPLLPALRALCRQFGVPQLYVFGSAVTEQFDASRSDLDVLATAPPLAPLAQGEALLAFWNALESLSQRRVDLLTPDSLQNPFLKAEIEQTKYLVYEDATHRLTGSFVSSPRRSRYCPSGT